MSATPIAVLAIHRSLWLWPAVPLLWLGIAEAFARAWAYWP